MTTPIPIQIGASFVTGQVFNQSGGNIINHQYPFQYPQYPQYGFGVQPGFGQIGGGQAGLGFGGQFGQPGFGQFVGGSQGIYGQPFPGGVYNQQPLGKPPNGFVQAPLLSSILPFFGGLGRPNSQGSGVGGYPVIGGPTG